MCSILRKLIMAKSPITFSKNVQREFSKVGKKPFTILVEGNIGSGKSTFLNNFRHNENILKVYEPIEEWRNVGGVDLMTLFYEDPKTWAFTFQSHIMLTMMRTHEQLTDKPIKMMERSIYSGRYVFIENLANLKYLTSSELAVLDEWFSYLTTISSSSVDLIVYLKTDPAVAYRRVKSRGRIGENKLTLEYITMLHECHENWLFGKNGLNCPAPVVCLNANKDIEEVRNEYMDFEKQINFQ